MIYSAKCEMCYLGAIDEWGCCLYEFMTTTPLIHLLDIGWYENESMHVIACVIIVVISCMKLSLTRELNVNHIGSSAEFNYISRINCIPIQIQTPFVWL